MKSKAQEVQKKKKHYFTKSFTSGPFIGTSTHSGGAQTDLGTKDKDSLCWILNQQ